MIVINNYNYFFGFTLLLIGFMFGIDFGFAYIGLISTIGCILITLMLLLFTWAVFQDWKERQ